MAKCNSMCNEESRKKMLPDNKYKFCAHLRKYKHNPSSTIRVLQEKELLLLFHVTTESIKHKEQEYEELRAFLRILLYSTLLTDI